MTKMNFGIIVIFSLLVSLSSAKIVSDYCVGDMSLPNSPAGYPCKNPSKVSADDFVFSGLRVAGNNANLFKFGASYAIASTFPALNGMDISIVRADVGVGGVVPLHTHRVAEIVTIIEGTIIGGFIDSNNTAFYKTLTKGDIMVFPPTLLHFQLNVGSTPVLAYASFASENPGFQVVSNALFRSNLPSELIEKITLIDDAQIMELKKLFGHTN